MKTPPLLLAALTALVLSGCLSPVDESGRLRHRDLTVDLSGLDWIEVSYYPAEDDLRIKDPCRLSLFGAGEVVFKTGRSPQIWDSFSDKLSDPNWNEVFSDRMHLDREEMQAVFQAFVDEGLVHKSSFTRRPQAVDKPYVRISAQVGREQVRLTTDNAHMVALVEEALENFSDTLAQAAAARRVDGQP